MKHSTTIKELERVSVSIGKFVFKKVLTATTNETANASGVF